MSDFASREFNSGFRGLVTTSALFGVIGAIALIGFETLRQLKRLPSVHFRSFRDSAQQVGKHAKGDAAERRYEAARIRARRRLWWDWLGLGSWSQQQLSPKQEEALEQRMLANRDRYKNGLGETPEDWEMGHLYMARQFHASTPSPPLAKWPLAWAWQAMRFDDWFYATHTGMDTVVYVRFLRAAFWWMFLQTFTTAPILLAVHLKFSKGVPLTDMSRASLSYLILLPPDRVECPGGFTDNTCPRVPNEQGRGLLWIHLCLIIYITATWIYAMWWLGSGSVRIRRRLIERARQANLKTLRRQMRREKHAEPGRERKTEASPRRDAEEDRRDGDDADQEGLLARAAAHDVYSDGAQPSAAAGDEEEDVSAEPHSDASADEHPVKSHGKRKKKFDISAAGWRQRTLLVTNMPSSLRDEASVRHYFEHLLEYGPEATPSTEFAHAGGEEQKHRQSGVSPVQTVVLVRKMTELSSMLQRRQEVLEQLEAAHIKLAKAVLQGAERGGPKLSRKDKRQKKKLEKEAAAEAEENEAAGRTSVDSKGVDAADLAELRRRLRPFLPRTTDGPAAEAEVDEAKDVGQTIWEVLLHMPRELLDPYQPVTRLSALFRGQTVPTIDYLLTKLNLLTALVTEMRSRPPSSYEPTSSAFVTFRDPRQARMVWRELDSQLVIKVKPAPEVKDLDWERLMRTTFTGALVRGFGVNAFFWGFTVFWTLLIQIVVTALFSVQSLKAVFPPIAPFFERNPQFEGFVSVTMPPLIISLVTMLIPELVFQISKRAQGFVTFSALYDQCLCRYWKFIICNIVIFFCIGTATVKAILTQIGSPIGTRLDAVAFSFPVAAPFFVSYFILCMGTHSGMDLLQAIIGLVQHLGARNAGTPRSRAIKSLPRNFNRYYWLPFHNLMIVIVFIFAVLNPLVIPFALLYLFFALVVFKKNLAYVYFRRFSEKEGVLYFVRMFRFSLDGLIIAQVVLTTFFGVTQQRAVYIGICAALIPITVITKVLGTRLWKSQVRALEDDEANAAAGLDVEPSWLRIKAQSAVDQGPLGLRRADGRFPEGTPPPSTLPRFYRTVQYIHDLFHANGNDRPGILQSKGHVDPLRLGATTLFKVQEAAVGQVGGRGKKIRDAWRLQRDLRRLEKAEREKARQNQTFEPVEAPDTLADRAQRGLHDSVRLMQASSIRHKLSIRSEEVPYIDSIDAINFHAPQGSSGNAIDADHDGEKSLEEVILLNESGSIVQDPLSAMKRPSTKDGESPTESSDDHASERKRRSDKASFDGEEPSTLVCPHPGVIWEDHPNDFARYNNPFYNAVLDPFLWLPRIPNQPIDLCDTIEWYGPALVSSQGGRGKVGEWDEDETSDDFEKHVLEEIDGEEAIVMSDTLARHLEQVEECDESIDPAASVPKAVMADYRRAIGAHKDVTSEHGSLRMSTLLRINSRRSDNSVASPPVSPAAQQHSTSPTRTDTHLSPPTTGISHDSGAEKEGALPSSHSAPMGPATSTSHVAFAEAARHPSTRLPGLHSRRVTNASYMSHGTMVSAASVRSISMRQALQAEVLEEERRTAIGKRLAKQQQKAAEKKRRGHRHGDEEAVEVDDAAGNLHHSIMSKHERAAGRRPSTRSAAADGHAATMPATPKREGVSQWGAFSWRGVRSTLAGRPSHPSETHEEDTELQERPGGNV